MQFRIGDRNSFSGSYNILHFGAKSMVALIGSLFFIQAVPRCFKTRHTSYIMDMGQLHPPVNTPMRCISSFHDTSSIFTFRARVSSIKNRFWRLSRQTPNHIEILLENDLMISVVVRSRLASLLFHFVIC